MEYDKKYYVCFETDIATTKFSFDADKKMKLAQETIDSLGPLTVRAREKLAALLADPTPENWNLARWVIINRRGLSLQDACGRGTLSCPSQFVLLRAMQKAKELT